MMYNDIFDIIPEDTTKLSDGEYEWLTTLGYKWLPSWMVKEIDSGEFNIATASKHSSGYIGEIYCDLDLINCDVWTNTCDLRVINDFGNVGIYEIRKHVKQLFRDMLFL